MAYESDSGETEQVGFNLLGARTQQLSMLNNRAVSSYLRGRLDDYFFSLVALRQNLTPNLNPKERKVLNRLEKEITVLKKQALAQENLDNIDKPGASLLGNFKRNTKPIGKSFTSDYVAKIKTFEQALLIVMKKKGFYPGKVDSSAID